MLNVSPVEFLFIINIIINIYGRHTRIQGRCKTLHEEKSPIYSSDAGPFSVSVVIHRKSFCVQTNWNENDPFW